MNMFVSDSRGGLWKRLTFTVNALTTINTDTFPMSDLSSVDYAITIFNQTENVFKSFYLRANKKNSNVVDTVYGKIGDSINFAINAKKELNDYVLEIQNNENYPLDIWMSKLKH